MIPEYHQMLYTVYKSYTHWPAEVYPSFTLGSMEAISLLMVLNLVESKIKAVSIIIIIPFLITFVEPWYNRVYQKRTVSIYR